MGDKCKKCMWHENCAFKMPCNYFTPTDYMDRIVYAEERRRRERFYEEWNEYVEYWDDENT